MDEQTREKIFDPFFTTKESGKGTGLDLSTVYGIVNSHGGHIFCYSELGQGTTSKAYLPAFHQAGGGVADQTAATREQPAGGHESILLGDDEKPLVELGRATILAQASYEVVKAQSGEEALELYRQHQRRLNLVVINLGTPGIGEQQSLEAILQLDLRAKVIIASDKAEDSLRAGAVDYVAKPFRRVDLLVSVRKVLDGCGHL